MSNRSLLLIPMLIGLLAGTTLAAVESHPLLTELGIDAGTIDGPVYLVRSSRPVPTADGYRVIGSRRDLSVLIGDETAITALSMQGCFVGLLEDAPPPRLFATSPQWQPPRTASPTIADMVGLMTWSRLEEKINWLTEFDTRYSYSPTCDAAADSLQDYFANLGLDVRLQPFIYNTNTMYNVIATQPGTANPDSIIIICGHYDSTSESPYVLAPGADDNGSGTAVVMACAEILSQYDFRYTLRYVCFAGEEQSLRGSNYFALSAVGAGDDIIAVLNYDMMGYGDTGVELDLEIETNNASIWLANIVTAAADLYTTAAYELHVDDNAWWGDHYSFWLRGFAAINHEEAWDWGDPDFNPYYHSTQDLITHVHPGFMEANGQVAVASLATLAVPAPTSAVPAAPQATLSAHPNPFNGRVRIHLEGHTEADHVDIDIFDLRGRRIRSLPVAVGNGSGQTSWDGNDGHGRPVESGPYFCRVRGERKTDALRIVHVK